MSNQKQTIGVLAALVVVAGVVWYAQDSIVPIMRQNVGVPNDNASTSPVLPGFVPPKPITATAPTPSAGAAKKFVSTPYGFSFEYPGSMSLEATPTAGGFTSQGAVGVVSVFTRLDTVIERFSVSVSAEPSDLGVCTQNPPAAWTTIANIPFATYYTNEMKEGQNITTTIYRLARKTICYELRDTVVSSVTSELTARENAQQQANIAAAAALRDSIVRTFTFTY